MRVIDGLALAALLSARPSYIPPQKGARGSKAQGHAYEKKVGRWLRRGWPELVSGQWFEFRDRNGAGCCQVDHYVVLNFQVLLIECKLTETDKAFAQIDFLYRPVLQHIYGLPVTGVQVCKHLTGRSPKLITDLADALRRPGKTHTWHCLL